MRHLKTWNCHIFIRLITLSLLLAAFETNSDLTHSFCFRPPILMRFPNHSYHLCGCLNNTPIVVPVGAVCRGCMAPLHPGLILHV
ncbi:hypothetical protein DTO212C5_6456 [Paecilomyces variotii]|nr:hypothetical protein DTO212C5_6456 [Paecilomyces variotii]